MRRRLVWVWLAVSGGIVCTACLAQGVDAPASPQPSPTDGPIYFLIERAQDLDGLIQRLDQPDYVLLRGSTYETLQRTAYSTVQSLRPPAQLRVPTTSLFELTGQLDGELARLRLHYEFQSSDRNGPWVPLQLGGVVLVQARAGARVLPVRFDGNLGWQIQLPDRDGDGDESGISVEIDAIGRIRKTATGSSLEMTIPEAATTRVDFKVPGRVEDALAGADPLEVQHPDPANSSRVTGLLSPRRILDLRWNTAASPAAPTSPAIITAQGQIELQIGRGTLRSRAAWTVRCERGSVATLSFQLEPAETLIAVEVDDRPIPGDIPRDAATRELTIPLPEPLRAGNSTRVLLLTSRNFPATDTQQFVYHGTPILRAAAQSGVLLVGQESPELWVSGATRRGLRELDPRSERTSLAAHRLPVALAYQFLEQPFELELRVDSSPPLARCRSRSTIRLQGATARIESTFIFQMTRGLASDIQILLPDSLELVSRGPDTLIASSAILDAPARANQRILRLSINESARAAGDFALTLVSTQILPPEGNARIALPTPFNAIDAGSSVALFAPPAERIELTPQPGEIFNPQDPTTPQLWPWSNTPLVEIPRLLVHSTAAIPALSLSRTPQPLVIAQQSRLLATLEPAVIDIRQDFELAVESGALKTLDLLVPLHLESSFTLEGSLPLQRTRIGERAGMIQYRLQLTSGVSDRLRLRTRLQQPITLNEAAMTSFEIPRVQIQAPGSGREASSTLVSAQPGIDIEPEGPGWKPATFPAAFTDAPATASVKLQRSDAPTQNTPLRVRARAIPHIDLPALLVSRAYLHTTSLPDTLLTLALLRIERHPGSLEFELPARASWIQAWIAGQPVERIDQPSAQPTRFRLTLPADPGTPLVVGILYRHTTQNAWAAPRILGPHAVLQSFWEIQLPWNDALLGEPPGWSDENQWYFDRYVWKRRPAQSHQELLRWVSVSPADTAPAADLVPVPAAGHHGYLFARLAAPDQIAPWRMNRAWLVVFASGTVLLSGLALLLGVIPARAFAWATLLLVILAAAFVPSSLLLAIGQSATVGVLLLLIAYATRWLVERRASRGQIPADTSSLRPTHLPRLESAPPLAGSAPVGSEDSTVIRSGRSLNPDARTAAPMPSPTDPALSSSSGARP